MNSKPRALAVGIIVLGLAGGVQGNAADSQTANAEITICVRNYAELDSKTLVQAKKVAQRIFQNAGVQTAWVDGDDLSDVSAKQGCADISHIQLHILSPAMAGRLGLTNDVMGLAPGKGTDRRFVYVFYDLVKQLAQRQLTAQTKGSISQGAGVDHILGEMMAHEIGHVLLNLPSHSETGIMRGEWDMHDLNAIAYGSLFFTKAQAERMRSEVARRVGQPEIRKLVSITQPIGTQDKIQMK